MVYEFAWIAALGGLASRLGLTGGRFTLVVGGGVEGRRKGLGNWCWESIGAMPLVWDFQMIDDVLLAPVVEALAPIANITTESQVNNCLCCTLWRYAFDS
ncbi:hypothetical protein AXF42_Ash021361 [Apostasia shenzhenica]|uniref:Uncharacterized protein n=1 Tax=Apostasia shenzhenica TaxID=1088818 RepID=A0A2H9ZYX3_9ASPA|nr:hypothetical protein AXF42_Ash021361 [Apostasia shenzhenica]